MSHIFRLAIDEETLTDELFALSAIRARRAISAASWGNCARSRRA
jgi:hypothetical protein